ncbi:hypothetical protein [Tumidithrix elongata]
MNYPFFSRQEKIAYKIMPDRYSSVAIPNPSCVKKRQNGSIGLTSILS